ncbi:MAG: peptidase C11 [Oscillospiraceae bacterium]|nr:peptidase C11 [Oscillospiraceae bacterium]
MAEQGRRPQGRETYVTGNSKGVQKRGGGLGTGPVGSGSGGSSGGGGGPSRSSGGGRGSLVGLIVAAVVALAGGGGLLGGFFGGSDTAELPAATATQYGGQTGGAGSLAENNLLGSILGSGIGSSALGQLSSASTVSGWSGSDNSGKVDDSVASGVREKYTRVLGAGRDQVTLMVYMCGTDLESKYGMATADLSEMAAARFGNNVKIVVYTGGCSQWKTNGISTSTNQIYELSDGRLTQLVSNAGTGAMTDPATLSSFIRYCAEHYPANRNELILWDHGGGSLSGYGYDEKNARSGSMNLQNLRKALEDGGVKFDFIGFDACLMATVETGLLLDDYADYMIASEETEPGIGWYYTDWLNSLGANTSLSTVEIGRQIADGFVSTCAARCRGQSATLSVVDLAELAHTVPGPLKTFSESLSDKIAQRDYISISDARAGAREFARSSAIDQIDLVDFAAKVGSAEAQDLAEALLGAVKYNRVSSDMKNAYGLSIYFPYRKTGNVSAAVRTYDAIGIDSSYSDCIRAFASVEAGGQAASGGANNALSSLLGSFTPSSGGSDMIGGLLGSLIAGGGLDFFSDRALSQQETASYIADNFFDAANLRWQEGAGGPVIAMPEDQWALVTGIEVNMFYDDGSGYIDLGLDNVFQFDDNGYLMGQSDGTWLAVNDQPVAFYHDYDVYDDEGTMLTYGTVPVLLNGERAELLIVLEHGRGAVTGARYVYRDGQTDTIAKSVAELNEGDTVDFICDYYGYDGAYLDSYLLGQTEQWTGDWRINNVPVGGPARVTWRFTDIYQQHYWTEPIAVDG